MSIEIANICADGFVLGCGLIAASIVISSVS